MEVFIVFVVIIFAIMVISVNSEKIRKHLRDRKPKESTPKPKPAKKEKYEDNMSYSEYKPPVKVDDLGNPDEYEVGTLNQLDEMEEKELENKSKGKAGRLRGDIKSAEIQKVEVEDLGEYDENEGFFESDDMEDLEEDDDLYGGFFFPEQNKSISQEIKDLSPELKALLINNVLDKKDEDF